MKFPKLTQKTIVISISIFLIISTSLVITLLSVIDNVPPTVAFANPISGDICSGIQIVELDVQDTGSIGAKVKAFEIYIDDTLMVSEESFSWDTTEYEDGYYTLKAKVFDKSGNMGEEAINVTVDNFINSPPVDLFKLLNYNILESGAHPEWRDIVKKENPDIAVFVETGDWDNNDDYLLNQYLKEFNGYFYKEAPFEGYTVQGEAYSTSGVTIFSRYPIQYFDYFSTVYLDDDSEVSATHDFIHAIVNIQGKEVHIVGYHLKASAGVLEEQKREQQTEGIINFMDTLGDVPLIFIGDLNSLSPTDTNQTAPEVQADFGYGPATMLLDPSDSTYGQYSSKVHNFTDVYRYFDPNDTIQAYTLNILNMGSRIDFIMVNQHFNNTLINSTIGIGTELDDLGSDHYSVDAFISITNISTSLGYKYEKINLEKNFVAKKIILATALAQHITANIEIAIITIENKKFSFLF